MIDIPFGEEPRAPDTKASAHWGNMRAMSSVADAIEHWFASAGFDRGPWLTVGFACGIATWFVLDGPWQWVAAIAAMCLTALGALSLWRDRDDRVGVRMAVAGMSLIVAFGIAVIWLRSEMVGAEPIERPNVGFLSGRILEREDQPARDRIRLIIAMRDAELGRSQKVRINVPLDRAEPALAEGAVVRLRARLMPPAPPMLPGAYDFARTAWFAGYAATGTVLGDIEVTQSPPANADPIAQLQRYLSRHVRGNLGGSPGTIAAAFASGDRGGIAEADEEAMRDSGLTHLLSISGLHVSAVIAAAYLLAIKLLALWPWLTLRVRLPVLAAGVGALAGIGYTLLTGSEVPTVRSCVGAVLVLIALAIGREALSLRMVAVAAFLVLLVWPESLVGPSFQMSFSAVIAIVALHNSSPVKAFLAPREESWFARMGRRTVMLLITGFVIEIALMPIVLFHFHRAGVYGALANVIAIPLVTFASMPLIAIALALDVVGIGAPAWWMAGKSLELLLWIAHFTAAQPGAVKLMPQMSGIAFALFVSGGLWLALWTGKARLLGFVPAALATAIFLSASTPDLLISGDGRHVGIVGEGDRLLTLREGRSTYARDNLLELAGQSSEPIPWTIGKESRCSPDFCVITLERAGRNWVVMMARSRNYIDERPLAAACDRVDIVIADRWLPGSCRPKWLKADRNFLGRTGGLAVFLNDEKFHTVASYQGQHGWWRQR